MFAGFHLLLRSVVDGRGRPSLHFPLASLASTIASFIYMTQIQIPSPLRQYSGKQASVDVPGKTVGEALAGLISRHPELKRHLYNDDGKLRAFVNVYVNDEDMRYLQKEATELKDGDTISIVPSIAGGCCAGCNSSVKG
jgi:sulfur-carrier protein